MIEFDEDVPRLKTDGIKDVDLDIILNKVVLQVWIDKDERKYMSITANISEIKLHTERKKKDG